MVIKFHGIKIELGMAGQALIKICRKNQGLLIQLAFHPAGAGERLSFCLKGLGVGAKNLMSCSC